LTLLVVLTTLTLPCERDLKGTFQVYIFRSFQILAYFHSKYQYIFFTSKGAQGSPLDTPLVPPIRSAIIDILMVTRMAIMQWCGL